MMHNVCTRFLTPKPTFRRRLVRSGSDCWGILIGEPRDDSQRRLLLFIMTVVDPSNYVMWSDAGNNQCRALPVQFLQRMALFFFSIHFFFLSVLAQLTQVPPLQWINLSNLLQGSSQPPPLRDAAMGYDDTRLVFHPLNYLYSHTSQSFNRNFRRFSWEWLSPVRNLSVGLVSWHQLYILIFSDWILRLLSGPVLPLRLPSRLLHPREVPLFLAAILLRASE